MASKMKRTASTAFESAGTRRDDQPSGLRNFSVPHTRRTTRPASSRISRL
ncbi:MAG TPA: hypothetical protein VNK04_05860 [Gemmataceae bacterium]|nr:hypothetical protein [Gemmataceae bacterium]